MRRVALLAVLAALLPATAGAQDSSLSCNYQLATAGGQALTCPLGGIRNVVDIEGGTAHYQDGALDRSKLDLNISSGEADGVRSRVAINPDVGGPGTVIFDGRKHQIASFYPQRIDFYAPVVFHDPVSSVASGTEPKLERIEQRVYRLQARVTRLKLRLQRHLQRLRRNR